MIQLLIYCFINFTIIDFLDIVLVALLLYEIYRLIRGTAAINIFIGILFIYFIFKIVSGLGMQMLSEILGEFISVGVIALIIVFQQEIRRFLLLLGTRGIFFNRNKFFLGKFQFKNPYYIDIQSIIKAINKMSSTRTGALIVITKKNTLEDISQTGVLLEAKVSDQLLESIFYKNNPLHDGAVIILNNKIHAAKCVLPITTKSQGIPEKYGLRHRAAIGITEQSDAVVIVVSEQTGQFAYCKNGEIIENIYIDKLITLLEQEFNLPDKSTKK
jgi:uncharacterized protein (TIGR00159 family)